MRVAILAMAASTIAIGADFEYKVGATFTLRFTNNVQCEMKVVARQGDEVMVEPRKKRVGCPTARGKFALSEVIGTLSEPSSAGEFAGVALFVGGLALGYRVAHANEAGGLAIVGGSFAGMKALGWRRNWRVYVNRTQLDPP